MLFKKKINKRATIHRAPNWFYFNSNFCFFRETNVLLEIFKHFQCTWNTLSLVFFFFNLFTYARFFFSSETRTSVPLISTIGLSGRAKLFFLSLPLAPEDPRANRISRGTTLDRSNRPPGSTRGTPCRARTRKRSLNAFRIPNCNTASGRGSSATHGYQRLCNVMLIV